MRLGRIVLWPLATALDKKRLDLRSKIPIKFKGLFMSLAPLSFGWIHSTWTPVHNSLSTQPRVTSRNPTDFLGDWIIKNLLPNQHLIKWDWNSSDIKLFNCSSGKRPENIFAVFRIFFSIYTSMCLSYFMYLLIYFRSCFGKPSEPQPSKWIGSSFDDFSLTTSNGSNLKNEVLRTFCGTFAFSNVLCYPSLMSYSVVNVYEKRCGQKRFTFHLAKRGLEKVIVHSQSNSLSRLVWSWSRPKTCI